MNEQRNLHVVLGTGPLGLAVARHLSTRGDRVRAVSRSGRADVPREVEVLSVNVAEASEVRRVADEATAVYHCANPPYARWPELHPPLMEAIIEGAGSAGARLIFGDNLYAYGPVDGPITEDLPYRAPGPNGQTRARIAEALMVAHQTGRVRSAIGRGSDFFGPHAHESTVGDRVFARALAGKPAQVLGNPDLPHTVTYIDDFARGLVTLGEREEALGQVWHVPNDETVTIRRFVEMVFEEVGGSPRLRAAPPWALSLAGLVNPTLRAVKEQLHQSERPWVVDSSKFEQAFQSSATPLQEAIRATVGWFREHTSSGKDRR